MVRNTQSGFSLIETLVAMTVLAVSATAILSASETHTQTVTAITERTLARWVAQNNLAFLDMGRSLPARVQMGGIDWQVRNEHTNTSDPDLGRVDISIATMKTPDVVLARLTGFVDLTLVGAK